jgi:hypothetical protein
MRSLVLTLACLCIASPAVATTCEESFQKKGDFFDGSAFAARVQIEGGTIEKTFSQLRPILARDGIKTLSSDVTTGVLKAENPATMFQRALPIDVFASLEGNLLNVEMVFTLPSGVGASRETVKKHLCSALNQLVPPVEAAAVPVKANDAAVEIEAPALVKQVKASADNPARLRVNFVGKAFQVSAKVLSIAESAGSYTVVFDGDQPAIGKASATKKINRATVVCTMAKNQDAAVAELKTNQRATLVGRFQSFDSKANAIQLQNCIGR